MKTAMEQHLRERGYDVSRYQTQWLTDNQLTVPLFDFDGKLKGYQTYTKDAPKKTKNPKESRYFTRMNGNLQLVWGLELPISIQQFVSFINGLRNRIRFQGSSAS